MPDWADHSSSKPVPGVRRRVRRRYDFGSSGWIYVGITLLLALGAFNSQNNLLFWAFGFSLAVVVVSGIISGTMLMGVSIERLSVGRAHAGSSLEIRYRVSNRNRLMPAFALSIEEYGLSPAGPPGLVSGVLKHLFGALFAQITHICRKRSPVPTDRPISERLGPARGFVAHVGAHESVIAVATANAIARGHAHLTGVIVHSSFPFGLMRKVLRFEQPGGTIILPAVIRPATGQLGISPSAVAAAQAVRRSGAGDDFFSLREYREGDPPRDIAWRASARRGGLLVKQTAASSPLRIWIVPVLRQHVGSSAQDELAISLAAGVAHEAERLGMEYGLLVPLTGARLGARRGGAHLDQILVDLARIELGPDDGRGISASTSGLEHQRGGAIVLVHGQAPGGQAKGASSSPSVPGTISVHTPMPQGPSPLDRVEHGRNA